MNFKTLSSKIIIVILFTVVSCRSAYDPNKKHPCDGEGLYSKECQRWKRTYRHEYLKYKLQRDEDSIYLSHPSRLKDFN